MRSIQRKTKFQSLIALSALSLVTGVSCGQNGGFGPTAVQPGPTEIQIAQMSGAIPAANPVGNGNDTVLDGKYNLASISCLTTSPSGGGAGSPSTGSPSPLPGAPSRTDGGYLYLDGNQGMLGVKLLTKQVSYPLMVTVTGNQLAYQLDLSRPIKCASIPDALDCSATLTSRETIPPSQFSFTLLGSGQLTLTSASDWLCYGGPVGSAAFIKQP